MRWHEYHMTLLAGAEDAARLTPSQVDVLRTLSVHLGERAQRLNLHGDPGVGKTFVARALQNRTGGTYLADPDVRLSIPEASGTVIVDNAPDVRTDARVIFGDLFWRGAAAVVLITRRPIHDDVCSVPLVLTDLDRFRIAETAMYVLGIELSPFEHSKAGLWSMLARLTQSD